MLLGTDNPTLSNLISTQGDFYRVQDERIYYDLVDDNNVDFSINFSVEDESEFTITKISKCRIL